MVQRTRKSSPSVVIHSSLCKYHFVTRHSIAHLTPGLTEVSLERFMVLCHYCLQQPTH